MTITEETIPLPVLSEGDVAYAAGFFDGEGSVTISLTKASGPTWKNRDPHYYHSMKICVPNTNLFVLEWLKERFGGSIHVAREARGKWRKAWRWQLTTMDAERFLRVIRPKLLVKDKEVDVALAFRDTVRPVGRGGLKAGVHEIREQLRLELLALRQQAGVWEATP